MIRRRSSLAALAAATMLAALPLTATAQVKIKAVMAWKYNGTMAWFYLAQEKGYFKVEGLDVQFDQGDGSASAITKVASGAYQAGFGDINAVIDLAAKRPAEAPVGVYMMNNIPPFTLVVKKDSPIKTPKDLEGKTVGGPASDGALKMFPALAKASKVDVSKVNITNMAPNLREQMLLRGQVDAAFGYVNTIHFSAKLIGIDPARDLRYIKYSDYGLDLYSNALVFSKAFVKEHPQAVQGFVRALNRAFNETVANPKAAMDVMMKQEPLMNRAVETDRMLTTIKEEMTHPEIARIGLGDIDPERMKRAIGIVVEANGLPRTPTVDEVFDSSFLPPRSERASKL